MCNIFLWTDRVVMKLVSPMLALNVLSLVNLRKNTSTLKVHKREKYFSSDFEFLTIL
jgi:hypothetical protein